MDSATSFTSEPSGVTLLDVAHLLRSGGVTLLLQLLLLARLARVEWREERQRLLHMLGVAVLGFACLLSALLFTGGLVLAAAWDTGYRLPAFVGLVLVYTAGIAVAWHRLRTLAAHGEQSFSALREELAADAAVLKENL
jgi:uncharacterized membrane protein YqjE